MCRKLVALGIVVSFSVWLLTSCGGGAAAPPTPAPSVSLSGSSLTFTGQLVGTTSTSQGVTLTNSGNAALSITSIAVTGSNATEFAQTNTCGTSVAAGANCTISVTFTPSATGSRSASVTITDNASGSPHSVSLSGTGTAPAATLSATSLTFAGTLVNSTSAAQTVTLTNSGSATLNITGLSVSGDFALDPTTTCPSSGSVAASGTCTIAVTFKPTATGTRSGSVTITDDAGAVAGSTQTVALTGTGTAPVMTLSTTSLTFTNQLVGTASSPQTVTVSNSGTAPLTVSSANASGTNPGDFAVASSSTCFSGSIAAGSICGINVVFTPSAIGARSAILTISSDGGTQTVSLSGTGITLNITTTTLPSGTVNVAYSATLAASGGVGALTWSVSSGALPAGLTLAAGTAVISGTPTTAGTASFDINVTDSGSFVQSVTQAFTLTINPAGTISVPLTPGTATQGTLNANSTSSLTFSFPPTTVTQAATVTLSPVAADALSVPLQSGSTFVAAFDLTVSPQISAFNAPAGLSGTVDPTIPSGTTLQLAVLQNPSSAMVKSGRARLSSGQLVPLQSQTTVWVVVSTLVVGSNGALTQNLGTVDQPGIMVPGDYVLLIPVPGSTTVSNFGVALMGDDGMGTGNCAEALQVIHLYDAQGNPLATPTIDCLSYPNAYDLDGQALTPDGSQGVMVDGGNTVRFYSGLQTGVLTASTYTLDVTNYGGDGDSIAIMPNGDEAVVSADGTCPSGAPCVLLISGIVSGSAQAADVITVPDYRDGVVISNDGQVMLARGPSGLTVFAIAPVTPHAGSEGGTVSHSFTQISDLAALGSQYTMEDGRDGMAISPVDSSRAVIITSDGNIQLLTGLPGNPQLGSSITPSVSSPMSVAITPDGKTAIVGGYDGLSMISGVDTGTLAEVGTVYSPSYSANGSTVNLSNVMTLGITLDGKYVAACDEVNGALLTIPISSSGFGNPVGLITGIAVPYNDQMMMH